jgi:hypothetical protein
MIVPPPPVPAPTPMTPVTAKPPRKAMQPSFVSGALDPTAQQTGGRSLIGGTAQPLGA